MENHEIKKTLFEKGYVNIGSVFNENEALNYAIKLENYISNKSSNDVHSDVTITENQLTVYSSNINPNFEEYSNWPANKKLNSIIRNVFGDKYSLSNWNASGSPSGCGGNRRVHIDSRIPIVNPEHTTHVIAMIALTPFEHNNGSTLIYEKSHLSGLDPRHLENKYIRENFNEKKAIMAPGEVTLFLGQTLHDIGLNESNETRWGIIGYYTLWWVKPTYDFTVISPVGLSDEELMIYGFRSIPPHPFNFNKYTNI